MTAGEWLKRREQDWKELERLLERLESRSKRNWTPEDPLNLGRLYRGACADLAMSEGYNLAPATVVYLHQLVARSHNQAYRIHKAGSAAELLRKFVVETPRLVIQDRCVAISFALFWGAFLISMFVGYSNPQMAESAVGLEALSQIERMYTSPIRGREGGADAFMAGFYVQHNTSIGLKCFASGVFLGIGSIVALVSNAVFLGVVFGHMTGTPMAGNFYHFVTAHSVCELTAIVLAAGAGLRMGFSLVDAGGRTRGDAFRQEGLRALKVVAVAAVLFWIAAFIEGFISPSSLPYVVKAGVAGVSLIALIAYVVVLGRLSGVGDAD